MPKSPNILLIAIDSLRADHVSSYGYHRLTTPHIDRFATQGVLFKNTFSAHIPTTSAYASMLKPWAPKLESRPGWKFAQEYYDERRWLA